MNNGIECPPDFPDQQHKCQYFTGRDKCRKVNTWVEWLVLEGGQGKTRAQLSDDYKNRSDTYYNYQYFCKSVKARGKAHELDIQKIGNPVEYYLSQPPIKPLRLYHARRRAIVKYLRKRPRNFRNNFSVKTFTSQKLKTVVNAIDKFYFNGTLLDAMKAELERRHLNWNSVIEEPVIQYKIQDDKTESSALWVEPWMVTYKVNGKKVDELWRFNIYFNKHTWRWENEIDRIKTIDSIRVNTKLEALVVAVEHELAHAIVGVYKWQGYGNSRGHGEVFRLLNNRLFGHSDRIYTYSRHDSKESSETVNNA